MRARHFHPEWGHLAPASAFRTAGIALVALAIGATAAVCIVALLIAVSGADSSITARHALISAIPVVRPLATSAGPGKSFPASVSGLLQPAPESLSGSQQSAPANAAAPKAIHVEATVEHATTKKRITKKHYARNRWRDDRIRQSLRLVDRLKPQ